MVTIYPHSMSEGKITALCVDSEIIPISPFAFDKITLLIDQATKYYEAKSKFEEARLNFEKIKSEFESFTESNMSTSPKPPEVSMSASVPKQIETPPSRIIAPPEPTHTPTLPSQTTPEPVTVQSEAERICNRIKILSILKRRGKTVSPEDIKEVVALHTQLDHDDVTASVIEYLKSRGKIQ